MAGFDYSAAAELLPTRTAEMPPAKSRKPTGYGRYARASDAIRFAIEELPPKLRPVVDLKVDGEKFDGDSIRRLYESAGYPLARRATSQFPRGRFGQTIFTDEETPMKFRPLHDRVVIKRVEAEARTAAGIIIPDTAKEKPQEGEIIAVGPGGRDELGKLTPIDVKVGDRILFGKWSGTEVKIDGDEYLIMKESDVMGVLVETQVRKKAA